jgi:transcriptional repressor NrdR
VQCPYCGGDAAVLDSRTNPEGVRRRRSCSECKRRFTTYEKVAAPIVKVVKRSGKTEPFDPQKIVRVLLRVGRDRPSLKADDAVRLARTIEAQLVDERSKSIRSGELASRLLVLLHEVDRLAYERFAANYMDESGQLRTESRQTAEEDTSQLGLFAGPATPPADKEPK